MNEWRRVYEILERLWERVDVAKQARREREEEDKDKSHKKEKSVGGEDRGRGLRMGLGWVRVKGK